MFIKFFILIFVKSNRYNAFKSSTSFIVVFGNMTSRTFSEFPYTFISVKIKFVIICRANYYFSLYKDEKEYIMSTSKRLNEVVMATIKNTSSKDLIKEIETTFPQTGNEYKDSCARVFNSVIKSVQQLKHDL